MSGDFLQRLKKLEGVSVAQAQMSGAYHLTYPLDEPSRQEAVLEIENPR